jgi:hypothetical protein
MSLVTMDAILPVERLTPVPAGPRSTEVRRVLHHPRARAAPGGHEEATHGEIARRLARLQGLEHGGRLDPAVLDPVPPYLVPSDTLVGADAAARLRITGEHDLFGGLVPHGFVGTKAISHGLVAPDAAAPPGWSGAFMRQVGDAVLPGFSVFDRGDARKAAAILLERGPVRVKSVHGIAGRGQAVAHDARGLEVLLDAIEPATLAADGLVLEENLTEVVTFSVGQVRVGGLVASYHGRQYATPDNKGEHVYGGSSLEIVRGGFEALLRLPLPRPVRLAVLQADRYDRAADAAFPGLIASRRNYDVARGRDARGRMRSGVLEQSWRVGGASGAEIAGLEALQADPALGVVRARTVEVYGAAEPPPDAVVYFHGIDAENGPMLKYTVRAGDDDTGRGDCDRGR